MPGKSWTTSEQLKFLKANVDACERASANKSSKTFRRDFNTAWFARWGVTNDDEKAAMERVSDNVLVFFKFNNGMNLLTECFSV